MKSLREEVRNSIKHLVGGNTFLLKHRNIIAPNIWRGWTIIDHIYYEAWHGI